MMINGYELLGELKSDNSGFSKWGFARKNGAEYFIKEFLSPVYPQEGASLSPRQFENRRADCARFEQERRGLYAAINAASRGNLVRIAEFFRSGSRYYIVTECIRNGALPTAQLAALPMAEKLNLCKSVAYCFACLHRAGIVHFDVKPANILVRVTANGHYVPKVIDFDCAFHANSPPDEETELTGDPPYLAPETFLRIRGDAATLSCKTDVFSLGLLFHEYFTGVLPAFSADYEYAFEAALDGGALRLHPSLPPMLAALLNQMLRVDPETRISITTALEVLSAPSVLSANPAAAHLRRAGDL